MSSFVGANLTETYVELGHNTPGLGDIYAGDDGKRYRFVLYNGGAGSVAAVAGNFTYVYAVGWVKGDRKRPGIAPGRG